MDRVGICPLCKRDDCILTDHHLIPRSQGGKITASICRDCHRAIHAYYPNKELAARLGTIASLRNDKKLKIAFNFIGKRSPLKRTKMKRSRGNRKSKRR